MIDILPYLVLFLFAFLFTYFRIPNSQNEINKAQLKELEIAFNETSKSLQELQKEIEIFLKEIKENKK